MGYILTLSSLKKLSLNLSPRWDFVFVSIIGIIFSFAMSPSRIESLALTSTDDSPIYPAVVLKNSEIYSTIGISEINNSLVLMWTTLSKWFPALVYKYIGIDPGLFHTLFVYSQITFILLGAFRLSRSLAFSRSVGYVCVALLIIYESYFINMGAYGGQTWMPYTTWIAVGPLLFSWANFLDDNKIKGITLLILGTLIHPGMGLSAAILILATQSNLRISTNKLTKFKVSFSILITVATVSFFTTLPLRREQFQPPPQDWQSMDVFHWAAWNLSNGQVYFQQSKYCLIFTASILSIATLYRKDFGKRYRLICMVIVATTFSVVAQSIFYSINFREIASINLARTTIFSSIFLTIIASKILLLALTNLNNNITTKTSILVIYALIFPSSASFLLCNLSIAYYLYKNKHSKKYLILIFFLTVIIIFFYLSNLFDINKDTNTTFIKGINLYMPSTLSIRAVQSYLDEWTVLFMLLVFVIFILLQKYNLFKITFIILVMSLTLTTILGRLSLSHQRFNDNSDWINTQVWVQKNSMPEDIFISTGSTNLYGAWTTLTRRFAIPASSNYGGGLYLYSNYDKKYELLRNQISAVPVSYSDIENFEPYIIKLASTFEATYLLSSHLDVKYSFPIVYSTSKYTIYKIKK